MDVRGLLGKVETTNNNNNKYYTNTVQCKASWVHGNYIFAEYLFPYSLYTWTQIL